MWAVRRQRRLNLVLSRSDKGWRAPTTGSDNGLFVVKNAWERRLMPAGNSALAATLRFVSRFVLRTRNA
jgi:hypothetical protein